MTGARVRTWIERAVSLALGAGAFGAGCVDGASTDGAGGGAAETSASTGELSGACAPAKFDPDPPDTCGVFLRLACGLPSAMEGRSEGCYLSRPDCEILCGGTSFFNCHAYGASCVDGALVPQAGALDVECTVCNGAAGRRPRGLLRARARVANPVADWFVGTAFLEGASVFAFERLAAELTRHGAPERLARAATRARADELRHARITRALARRFGGAPVDPRARRASPRSLAAMAIENAVEGCVRETFAAALVAYQANACPDRRLARTFARVARDEADHAALAWDVHAWLLPRLDPRARSRVRSAARRAARALERDASEPAPEVAAALGAPSARARAVILAGLAALFAATGCASDGDASTGSSSTTASSSSGASCGDIGFDTSACGVCASAACCEPLASCTKGTACRALRSCTLGCAWGDPACPTRCRDEHPDGTSALDALDQCLASSCPDDCAPKGHEVCDSTIVVGGEACAQCLGDHCCQPYVDCAEPDPDGCAACVDGSGPCSPAGGQAVACKAACKVECGS
ncbi:MAG: ferritin-like domain-containing protein [Polyangiaceae bacterium]